MTTIIALKAELVIYTEAKGLFIFSCPQAFNLEMNCKYCLLKFSKYETYILIEISRFLYDEVTRNYLDQIMEKYSFVFSQGNSMETNHTCEDSIQHYNSMTYEIVMEMATCKI